MSILDYLCSMYAVIDVETTGLKPSREKITEIAIILTDGKEIQREWHTLLNPGRPIPAQITRLTGITNNMVADAPSFAEVAQEIISITEGRTFVAHNASFDYNFIREEFRRVGIDFRRNKKCTVQLSRRVFPGQKSYGLGKLCHVFGIENDARHRASGDAMATVQLFQRILNRQKETNQVMLPMYLPPAMDKKTFDALPEKTGVYYFIDENDRIIYVGKSLNIKERVKSHFASPDEREQKMKTITCRIDYELTGSELVALLLESDEIKKHRPVFNRRQRRQSFNFGLFSYPDEDGYLRLETGRINSETEPHTTFSTARAAKEHLRAVVEKYFLCQKLSGLYKTEGACFHFQVHQCLGACIKKEEPDTYNRRVREMLKAYELEHNNHLIVDVGRNEQENSLVLIYKGKYRGFGFVDSSVKVNRENMMDFITSFEDNKDIRQIIRSHLRHRKVVKVVDLSEG